MNKARRMRLTAVQSKLSDLKAEIEQIRDDEQEVYDNLPEDLQDSERGVNMEAVIDKLDDAAIDLGGVIDTLEAATE